MQIQTMDEYVFWEETGNCADEVPIEEMNDFFREYVKKNGSGIHHIAFEVDDIQSEINRLEAEGFDMIYNPARSGADNKLVTFIHPKGTDGILIELCQENHNSK